MALKSFTIPWEGAQETIEYEDDITFGELENILNKCLDLTDITKPKVNIPLYRQLILSAVIKKAPFEVNDTGSIRNLKASTAKIIMKGVMKDYPLVKHLGAWVETFTGLPTSNDIESQSTTSLPQNLAGTKKQ